MLNFKRNSSPRHEILKSIKPNNYAMAYYLIETKVGIESVTNIGDGYSVVVEWFEAKPSIKTNKIAYNIYYSIIKENVFSDGPKFLSISSDLEVNIIGLEPGENYFFSVRPIEYNPTIDLSLLPISHDQLRIYPTTILRSNISNSQSTIPVVDTESFPLQGVVKIGAELIQYNNLDQINNNLLFVNRGFAGTKARSHTIDGYDGYFLRDPNISFYILKEETIYDRIYVCECRFEFPYNQFTFQDGYHQVTKDLLTSDLSASDEFNEKFPTYDYSGYHRTDPTLLFSGACVGSYIGGQQGCIDGYGNFNIIRGISMQDSNNQRQEMLLSLTARPAVLLRAMRQGITCACYTPNSEYHDDRCPFSNASKFVTGYEQIYWDKRSDGRIMVRVSPTDEALKMNEAGLESELPMDAWTLTVPTIKMRDIIILFDQNDNEEFRYEVSYVTRNNTLFGLQGAQKMKLLRIRKTDPAYQIRAFRNTSQFPSVINTGIGGNLAVPPHVHVIKRNEKDPSTWSQTTSISSGHSHGIIISTNGLPIVQTVLNHTHEIII
jgi:hypothetical protein